MTRRRDASVSSAEIASVSIVVSVIKTHPRSFFVIARLDRAIQ
jgi:hypothetical protein